MSECERIEEMMIRAHLKIILSALPRRHFKQYAVCVRVYTFIYIHTETHTHTHTHISQSTSTFGGRKILNTYTDAHLHVDGATAGFLSSVPRLLFIK